ncbi:MAG: 1-deoxy-D-xylulose-5-phosphate reductoisomerase [Planctomycetota bacterium]|jgi:1-deoxy-D-xylulose-5-phosphate reductoisomerase
MKKKIAILGSTGSIGRNACEVVKNLSDELEIVALSAGKNTEVFIPQVKEFKPAVASLADAQAMKSLDGNVPAGTRIVPGSDLVAAAFDAGADVVVNAISGVRGLDASEETLRAGKILALANKESLVAAGEVLFDIMDETDAMIFPIDSEHSAVFQALLAGEPEEIASITLTASGGPFRSRDDLGSVTREEALDHPTWSMGRKITIDSATMMNKALEVIEAHWFFGLGPDNIRVVIHPQSIVHGMVEFVDGSVIAQLGWPDMKMPIQYALTYPERRALPVKPLDLGEIGKLEFEPVDRDKFPAVALAERVINEGGTSGAVFNAANEEAVGAFLNEKIGFVDIVKCVQKVFDSHKTGPATHESIREADGWARKETAAWIAAR